jgi:hypothetical protein
MLIRSDPFRELDRLSQQALASDSMDATRTTDEFLEMLLADEDLLRAEFDAIIAAAWPSLPPVEPHRGEPADRLPRRHRRRVRAARLATRPHHPGVGAWARQRSPPCGNRNRQAKRSQARRSP